MKSYIFKQPHTPVALITLDEVKNQLKIELDELTEDDLLNHYRDAAIGFAEDYTSRNFTEAKYQIQQFGYEDMFAFPKSPVSAITQIQYLDEDGVWQILDTSFYELLKEDEIKSVLHYLTEDADLPTLKSGTGVRIKIDITVGYAAAEDLPEQDKQAIFLIFSFFYKKRDDSVQKLPRASTNLLTRFHYYSE